MRYQLFFVTAAIIFSASCGASPTNTTEAQNPPTAGESTSVKSDLIPVGTAMSARGDRSVTVKGSELVDSINPSNQFSSPIEAKGGKLAVVYLSLKNTGQESGNMMFTDFKMVDSQGRTYDQLQDFEELGSLYMWMEDKGLSSPEDQLFPGGENETAIVFRVAPDAEGLQLSVNDQLMAIQ